MRLGNHAFRLNLRRVYIIIFIIQLILVLLMTTIIKAKIPMIIFTYAFRKLQ